MSRLKNFSRNLATSYLQLGVNVIYSLASVPLILYWLPESEFGLWAVLVQLMSYLALIDLGINQAVARLLVDHKDQRDKEDYGSLIKTSTIVSLVQGLIVLVIVGLASPLLADLMRIPDDYRSTFITLMRIQGAISAFSFCTNPLVAMLYAHQRVDITCRQSIFGMVLSIALLTLFLFQNNGIYSFVYAGAITGLVAPCYYLWHCRRLKLFPQASVWGKVSWLEFKKVFLYGKDLFLMNLGAQLITASQVIIISSTLGLKTAAVWAVGTKIFTLVRHFMFQPYAAAVPGLYEMHARNETVRLRSRFQNVVVVGASLGAFLSISFVLCNSLFVSVWTSGRIVWPTLNDILLGGWLFFTAFQMTHCNFVTVTKQIGSMRYLYFVEGFCFVLLSLWFGYRWDLPGIIVCSVACVFFFSYTYGLWRSASYFQTSFYDLAVNWVGPSLKLAVIYALVALITWFSTTGMPTLWRLITHAAVAATVGGVLFLRVGLPREMIYEVRARLPRTAAFFLDRLLPSKV
jgi:O-antigen/teichoic acid export membrane protein